MFSFLWGPWEIRLFILWGYLNLRPGALKTPHFSWNHLSWVWFGGRSNRSSIFWASDFPAFVCAEGTCFSVQLSFEVTKVMGKYIPRLGTWAYDLLFYLTLCTPPAPIFKALWAGLQNGLQSVLGLKAFPGTCTRRTLKEQAAVHSSGQCGLSEHGE